MLLDQAFNPPITFSPILDPVFQQHGIELSLARLDLLPFPAGGNKVFKLKYNLLEAQKNGFDTLITFGGAYSNHLLASAESAHYFGFKSIGIVRGEKTTPLNETLTRCVEMGMQLYYMSRENYRRKNDLSFIKAWLTSQDISEGYLIPEGGSNGFAVKGVAEMTVQLPSDTDIVVTASGTGGTLAGIISGMKDTQEAWGIAVLKGGDFLNNDVKTLLLENVHDDTIEKKWHVISNYPLGGYAKCPDILLDFIKRFYQTHLILLDPIYTSKMMYALFDMASKGLLPHNKKIVALHSGGIQAWNGMPEKKLYIST